MISLAEGKVVISTEVDNSGFKKDAKQLVKESKALTNKINTESQKQRKAQKSTQITINNNSQKSSTSGIGGMVKEASTANSRLSDLSGTIRGIGSAIATGFVTQKLVQFGKESIGIASNLQEVQNVVDTSFGDMAYMVEEFASTSIEQFGMSELTAKRTASTYMAMSRSLGINQKTAAQMAISIAGLTGDLSSFYNVSQDVADTALKSIWTGETESLKEFGVVMTQANLQQFAYANGIKASIDKMSQAEQVQLRYAYVTQQLSLAQGDFAKTSGSWANQTRVLSERWKEFMGIIGNGLIQVLTPVIQFLNQALAGLISFAQTVSAALTKIFGGKEKTNSSVQQAQVDATQQTAQNMNDVVSATTDAGKAANKAKKEAQKAVASFDELNILSKPSESSSSDSGQSAGIGNLGNISTPSIEIGKNVSVSPNVDTAVNNLLDIFKRAQQDIAVKYAPSFDAWSTAFASLKEPAEEAMGRVATSATGLWQNTLAPFGTYLVGTWVPDIVNAFSTTFAPIFSDVASVAISEFGKDFEFMCHQIDQFVNDILWPAFDFIKTVVVDIFDGIKKAWDEHGAGILQGFINFKESLREIWDNLYNNILKPVFDRIGSTITWLWDEHLKPLWDNITNFIGSLIEYIMNLWNTVLSPIVNWLIQTLGPAVTAVVGTIGDIVGTVIGVISDVIGGIMRALSGLMDFISGVFTGNWEKAWNGICDFFGGIWDAIWGLIKGFINLIIDAINGLWQGIYVVVKAIVDAVGGIAGALGSLFGQDWYFSMPPNPPLIPKLAKGAVIPPNREFMAVLGDQSNGRNLEAPEGLIRQIVREESGAGISNDLLAKLEQIISILLSSKDIVMVANGREIARLVDDIHKSSDRRYRTVKVTG